MAKNFYVSQSVGNARHVVSFHDGVKTHKDGSPFYDVEICGNKRNRDTFIKGLKRTGYAER